jgi:hypothetical protein
VSRSDAIEIVKRVAPSIVARLQPGLSITEIDDRIATFTWKLPEAAYELYGWHNGLSGEPGKLNLVEKLVRLKGKWHGELSGRENEVHLHIGNRRLVTKFLPLDYALAEHRHLKLGRCPLRFTADGNLDRWYGDVLLHDASRSTTTDRLCG